jgi:hypothetical protein
MIWQWILTLTTNALLFFISLFPNMGVQDFENINKFNQMFGSLRDIVAWANWWFPVDTLFLVISINVSFYVLILLLVLASRIINALLPFIKL